ncbi:hypothetical protein NLJ89_g4875 [Agrocybe chaxingu]|uniref:Cytochrome P450 n=1 Tax=Agrocybe chaxingu TaxID=84603 RepID=A0A9W8MU55_9AGAR|nr:hypothetical protein NLJ89_g4875 [Agrocybe chaxingu]
MFILVLEAVALYGFSWTLWKICRRFFAKSPLDNIPGPPPKSIWKGVFSQVFNVDGWNFHREMAEKYGRVIKLTALFGESQLYVFDPKALHHIVVKVGQFTMPSYFSNPCVKDQYIYEETSSFIEGNRLMFGHGLLGTLGEQHRKQRKMLNPVFSIAHMRDMVPTFYNVTYKLRDAFVSRVQNGPREIEVLSWMTRTALELVGQSGFGFSFDPLTDDGVPHPYSTAAKRLVPVSFKMLFPRTYLLATLVKIGTPSFRRFLVDLIPWKALHDLRDVVDVLHNTSVEIIESKKKALAEGDESVAHQIGQGKDILSILLKANMTASEADKLSEEEMLGQMSTLTFAAMDTTSSALSRILWLLANHQGVQDKLRAEVREARKQGDLVYDDLVNLPYLDAIPTCLCPLKNDIVLPLGAPIKGVDGREIHEIPIPNNTNVIISILASNRNPEVWGPDSYDWKPERWLQPLPDTVIQAHIPGIYSHLMTFLGGGRACIGFKFSQLEMKVVLSILVASFKFSPSDKEIMWKMNGIATPTTADNETVLPRLPLMVELAA